jgi:hypothetical protein
MHVSRFVRNLVCKPARSLVSRLAIIARARAALAAEGSSIQVWALLIILVAVRHSIQAAELRLIQAAARNSTPVLTSDTN